MTGIAAVAMCAAFTSCSNNEVETLTPGEIQAMKYAESFAKTFGAEIDPQNDWGFGTPSRSASFATERTRGIYADANNWSKKYAVPADPEDNNYEIKAVTDYFTDHKFSDAEKCVKYENFFVYAISCTANGSSHMDNLHCGTKGGSMEHLYNFNKGTCSDNGWHGKSMCVEGGSSEYWTYESSEGTTHTFDHFYGVDGATIDSRLAGYYYIGFDYESAGGAENQVHAPDGYYNDWIIRISKAEGAPITHDHWTGRIFCEDLGSVEDFDFNDVVFDYDFADGKTYIKLLAAGGTIPLYIGDTKPEHEVHKIFGVDTNVMVNTGRTTRPEKIFVLDTDYGWAGGIPVIVDLSSYAANNDDNTTNPLQLLKAEPGSAPQKVCVRNVTSFPQWPSERERITIPYPKFDLYVEDHNVKWWEK